MAQHSEGLNIFLSWGLIEWSLTGTLGICATVIAWVWHLASRVIVLEDSSKRKWQEIEYMRKALVKIGDGLDKKIDADVQRVEERIDRMAEKLDELREQMPSRHFIEAQINNLQTRIDRSLDLRGLPSRGP